MRPSEGKRFIVYVFFGYLILGLMWIILSDQLIRSIAARSVVKGVGFIILTTGLFFVVQRYVTDGDTTSTLIVTKKRLPRWLTYSFASAGTLIILLAHMHFTRSGAQKPLFVIFMLPIILSSLLGGFGPGLVSTLITALGIDFYGLHLFNTAYTKSTHDLFQLFALVACGVLVSFLSGIMHRSRQTAEVKVTQLETALEPLRQIETKLLLAIQGANDSLWDWTMTPDSFHLSNRWKQALCYEENDLNDTLETWKQLIHPDDQERILTLITDIEEGRSDFFEGEFRILHCDGHYLDIFSKAMPVRDTTGHIIRLVGTCVNITGWKRIDQLSTPKSADPIKSGRWGFDVASGEVTWTDDVADIYDLDPETTTTRDFCLSFYHGENLEELRDALKMAVEEASPYDLTLELISALGRKKRVRMIGYPVIENDKVTRIEAIFQQLPDPVMEELTAERY
jgi:PAS domain S-box-containing protein